MIGIVGHSPPWKGGVAARLQEMAPFLSWRSRGGSYPRHNHPGRSCEVASRYCLVVAPTPPCKGGECSTIPITLRPPRSAIPIHSHPRTSTSAPLDQPGNKRSSLRQRCHIHKLVQRVRPISHRPQPIERRDSEGGCQISVRRAASRALLQFKTDFRGDRPCQS